MGMEGEAVLPAILCKWDSVGGGVFSVGLIEIIRQPVMASSAGGDIPRGASNLPSCSCLGRKKQPGAGGEASRRE